MKIEEKNKDEIQKKAAKMSDFLKLEYYENCLKKADITLDAKRFCHFEVARIYEDKKMFRVAARHTAIAAEIAITFKEKRNLYVKEAETLIKAEDYEFAHKALLNAISNTNTPQEKAEVLAAVKSSYKKQAEEYEKAEKRNKALKIYEKLYQETKDMNEKIMLREKLLSLYEKLGKIREFMNLKNR